jgi:hypothetical protein
VGKLASIYNPDATLWYVEKPGLSEVKPLWLQWGEFLERGVSPSFFSFPLMLRIHLPITERGIKGVRLSEVR